MTERQFSDRIGNVEERLVHQAGQAPNYGVRRRMTALRRLAALAAVIALMAASFTTGALAFSRETVVEVPAERETLVLEELGLTLILPDSWKGLYELVEWEGQYVVVCPQVREASLAQARAEWAAGGMEWPEELDRNPFSGGMLFYIFSIPGPDGGAASGQRLGRIHRVYRGPVPAGHGGADLSPLRGQRRAVYRGDPSPL